MRSWGRCATAFGQSRQGESRLRARQWLERIIRVTTGEAGDGWIAEAAARLVPRARATSENIAPEEEPEPDDVEKPDPESVPDHADPSGDIREINSSERQCVVPRRPAPPGRPTQADDDTTPTVQGRTRPAFHMFVRGRWIRVRGCGRGR
ncbi:hypothetical protein GCM10010344_44160 [Streptomyces bluensis]|nr:hypothetical protein GCM10010344_44160 [Streptomyces bluensis]